MRITPTTELEYRCNKLQEQMRDAGHDAMIIVQNADLFYFTGTVQSGCLYVPVSGQPLFLVRKDAGRARMESGLKEVIPCGSLRDMASLVADYGYPAPRSIAMEFDVLPCTVLECYRAIFPGALFSDGTPLIRLVRMIKSHYEIHLMKDAAEQVDKVFRRAREIIRVGMTDLDVAAELEFTARTLGHQGLVRMRSFNSEISYGHVFSGVDSAVPAYCDTPLGGMGLNPSFGQGAGLKRIEANEPIIIDFSGCVDGYLSDQTRLFSVGELPDDLMKAYQDMLSIQELMESTVIEGLAWGDLYELCREQAAQLGYADHFMGAKGAQVSFVGHGIGIEIDEYPFIARGFKNFTFQAGMAFAFEPKVVFPGRGAIGIENCFYLSNKGLKRLSITSDEPVILP